MRRPCGRIDAFDAAVFKKELLLGRQYFPKMNTIRLWLSYDAFIRQPDAMPKRFHRVVDLSEEVGLRFIPTLFNGWHSCPDFGVGAPLTVGSVPSMDSIRMLEPVSDVITFHPYFAWNAWVTTAQQFEIALDEAVAFGKSVGKPMLATETGWGALDDKKRSEVLAVELGALAKRDLGFVAHLLHHTLVADGHRPEYGPMSGAGYMAFLEKDGSLRPHHDIFNAF